MSTQWRTPEQLEARRRARARRAERRNWQQQMGGTYSWQEIDEREREQARWLNETRFRPWETE